METVNITPPAEPQSAPSHEDEIDLQMILLMTMLSIFSLVGSVGNGMVIFVFHRVRDKSTAQLFILFMAVIDLFTCMVIIPLTAFAEFTAYRLQSDLLCKIYHFLITSKVPLSFFIMVAIAVDRYLCICRPLHRIITRAKAKVIILCLFLVACVLGAISVLFHGMYQVFEAIDLARIDHLADTNFSTSSSRFVTWDLLDTLHAKNFSFPGCPYKDVSGGDDGGGDGMKRQISARDQCELKSLPQLRQVVNVEVCDRSFVYLSENMFHVYQTAYSSLFPLCLLAVFFLYSLIYRFMCQRRARKLHQKLILCSYVNGDGTFENTRLVSTPPGPDASMENQHKGAEHTLENACGKVPQHRNNQKDFFDSAPSPHTPHLVCLGDEGDAGISYVVENKHSGDASGPAPEVDVNHVTPLTQSLTLLDHLDAAQCRLPPSESLACARSGKYGHNLMPDPAPMKQFNGSTCTIISGFLASDQEHQKSLLNLPCHSLEKNHLSRDHSSSQHVNNNNCKTGRNNSNSSSGSGGSSHAPDPDRLTALNLTLKFAEISSNRSEVSSNETSPKSEASFPRRHSHCHPKQKYQWHKKRDSMRRYKGKNSSSKQPRQQKDHLPRRRSPLALDADKLSKENRKANVRTALMLFTVTLMFIVAYTPGWLMLRRIVPYNKLVFFLYFSYNVANPFIYAFMNHVFKCFMRKMFTCNHPVQSRI